jgi:sodium/bile acid cotransporter 7
MKALLARRWFLVLLGTTVLLASIWPDWFAWSGRLDPRFVVAPALFLMAWTLPSRRLAGVLMQPWPALWAVAISYGALPVAAWLASGLLALPDFRIGLLIVACVPCTLASAVLWTRMAGGDEATALLVVLLTTGTSWLVTPAWLAWTTATTVTVDTLAMMTDLFWTLVVPVGVGQLCRAVGPLARAATRYKTPLGVVSQLLILVVIVKAAASVRFYLHQEPAPASGLDILAVAGLCVGLHLLALGSGLWSSGLLRFDRPNQVAVAFACSQKTLPVALLVLERYYPQYPLAVVPLACYHIGQLVVDTFIADRLAYRQPTFAEVPSEAVV